MELQFCELYHCRPSELAEEDYETMVLHLALKDIEGKHLRAKYGGKG